MMKPSYDIEEVKNELFNMTIDHGIMPLLIAMLEVSSELLEALTDNDEKV